MALEQLGAAPSEHDPSCCHGNGSYSRPPWVGHVSLGSLRGPRRQGERVHGCAHSRVGQWRLGRALLILLLPSARERTKTRSIVVRVPHRPLCAPDVRRSYACAGNHSSRRNLLGARRQLRSPSSAERRAAASQKSTHGAVTADRGWLCFLPSCSI